MKSMIVVHPDFDGAWPWAADALHQIWQEEGPVQFIRLAFNDRRPISEIVADAAAITRMIVLHVPITPDCVAHFTALREIAYVNGYGSKPVADEDIQALFQERGVTRHQHRTEGFWGQSVSEYALALTLCGLRRIPQLHYQILTDRRPWNYHPPEGIGRPGERGSQYGDDTRFTNGTVAGKRVRIVGAGNIGSRYASYVNMLGADVAVWDPFASEPSFHRAGARREWHLERLAQDAEIFAPMLPLTDDTRGLIMADHIRALPSGCLVILATRANICHMPTLRERVLANELALAADVFDIEPLPLDDPLLGRENVVHTPHNAGRTRHANQQWAQMLLAPFAPQRRVD